MTEAPTPDAAAAIVTPRGGGARMTRRSAVPRSSPRPSRISRLDRVSSAGGVASCREIGVAVDGRSLAPPRTGIGVFTAALVDAWVAAGHEVTVLVDPASQPGPGVVTAPVVPLPRPFHLSAAGYARRRGLRYFSPDSLIVPALLGRRATMTVHDLAPLHHGHTHTARVRLAYRLLLATAVRRAGCVVVPSESTRSELLGRHPRARVVVTGEGPRTLPTPAALPDGVRPPYLLCVGSLEPRKHPVELAEAFAAVAPEPWQLVIAGPTRWLSRRDRQRLDTLVGIVPSTAGDAGDASTRIRVLGHVEDAVLSALLGGASALAYVSDYEGFGLPVLEGMAAGVPVLTTNAPALAELAGDAALLLDLRQEDAYGAGLRESLSRLLGDEALRRRLAECGQARAASYDWTSAAERAWSALSAPLPTRQQQVSL